MTTLHTLYVSTYLGHRFHPAAPCIDDVHIEDIAHGLSNTSRYSGQCKRHYSVATHSVIVAMFLPDELKFEGLLHDSTEAFMADIPTPLKILLPDYLGIERRLDSTIRRHFGLPVEISPEVKRVDHLVLAIEKPILMGQSVIHWDLPEIDHADPTVIVAKALISCATIESSKRLFLDFFKELKETKNV